jgi:hypothetical protein
VRKIDPQTEQDAVSAINPQKALDSMHKTGPQLAEARAERVYLEEYRKSLKALLMKSSVQQSAVMQEREAYADAQYLEHLKALRIAVEKEEALRWRMVTSQTAIEVWRTMEASHRAMERGAA